MGYYSNAVFAMNRVTRTRALIEFGHLPRILDTADQHYTLNENSKDPAEVMDYWVWRDQKWHSDYDDVVEFRIFLNALSDNMTDTCEDFGFIRIGADPDDLETHGNPGHYELHVRRTLEVPEI